MWKQNIEECNKNRDMDICGSPDMGYVHGKIVNPFFILSSKMKGYNL